MEQDQLQGLHDWLEAQKAYWQSLLSDQEKDPVDWLVLFEACRRQAKQQAPHISSELSEAMTQQVKGFCRYGERLLRALKDPEQIPELEEAIHEFSDHLLDQASARALKLWELPSQLSQFLNNLGFMAPSSSNFAFNQKGFITGAPHLDARTKEAEKHYLAFQSTLQEFVECQRQISRQTTHKMLQTLKQGETPASLGDLHSLWVECYEHCYKEQILTANYQTTYGHLSNATLALQKLAGEYWEQEYRTLGLVPRKDYDQLLERHHKLRKSHKQAQRDIQRLEQRLDSTQQAQTKTQTKTQKLILQLEKQFADIAGHEPPSE